MMRSRRGRIVKRKLVLQAPRKKAKCQSDARECGHAAKWRVFAPTIHGHQDYDSGLPAKISAASFRSVVRNLMFFDSQTTQEGCSTILYLLHSEEELSNSGMLRGIIRNGPWGSIRAAGTR
jgi:hypothetical protein